MSHHDPSKTPEARSKSPLYMALGIMLLPALIPLYFAMGADEPGVIVFLVSLSFVVALGNLMIVLAMWRWIGRLQG